MCPIQLFDIMFALSNWGPLAPFLHQGLCVVHSEELLVTLAYAQPKTLQFIYCSCIFNNFSDIITYHKGLWTQG